MIHKNAGRSSSRSSAEVFEGDVYVDQLVGASDHRSMIANEVTFTDGARTRWHAHLGEQVLLITSGRGVIGTRARDFPVGPGDVIVVEAGEEHWHGSLPGGHLTHIAILHDDDRKGDAVLLESVGADRRAVVDPRVTDVDARAILAGAALPAGRVGIRSQGSVSAARVRPAAIDTSADYSVTSSDVTLPVGDGLVARHYRPVGNSLATMVYFHGGGWALGDLEINDDLCRFVSEHAGIDVLSLDYPLAPEHPFPAAYDAGLNAVDLVHKGTTGISALPTALVLGGLSAGATLAAGIASALVGVTTVHHQLLVTPVLDSRLDRPSYREFAEGPQLTSEDMRWFWQLYDPSGTAREDPRAAPLRGERFDGLPSTTILIAAVDPLRDEALEYGAMLGAAGIDVEALLVPGVTHGFAAVPSIRAGREALLLACERIRIALLAEPRGSSGVQG